MSGVVFDRATYYEPYTPMKYSNVLGIGNVVDAGSEVVQSGISDCYVRLQYRSMYDVYINIDTYCRQSVREEYLYIIVDADNNQIANCLNSPETIGIKTGGNGEKLIYFAVLLVGGVAYSKILIPYDRYKYVALS